ncbi:MAG: hypothetical protein SFU56_21850 [Capsulimonadales bacterium]|nr:hypothetical protein [Capsulimonadales bacterium]
MSSGEKAVKGFTHNGSIIVRHKDFWSIGGSCCESWRSRHRKAERYATTAVKALLEHCIQLRLRPTGNHNGIHSIYQVLERSPHIPRHSVAEGLLHRFDGYPVLRQFMLRDGVCFPSPQAAHVCDYDGVKLSRCRIGQQSLVPWSVQVRTGASLVGVFPKKNTALSCDESGSDPPLRLNSRIFLIGLFIGRTAKINGVS